ncbi:hypothetical protein [Roseomonas marmotae]|uniref:hypothetical protein n=1 Tax=Roseomonas marmotae TaxID=2768161 RepID=UPI0038CF4084
MTGCCIASEHRIGSIFGRIKGWCRTATRHDRCAHTFMSAICLVATILFWINEPEPRQQLELEKPAPLIPFQTNIYDSADEAPLDRVHDLRERLNLHRTMATESAPTLA